jgi:hypothetical protein
MFFDFYGSIWYCLTRVPPLEKVLRNAEKKRRKIPTKHCRKCNRKSEAINMYERIEKCEVKRKDWELKSWVSRKESWRW